jgi:hypothetical protein
VANSVAKLLSILALIGSPSAFAISLPVDGVYGSGDGCKLLREHGLPALIEAGGTEALTTDEVAGIILTPNEIVGPDWTCRPLTVDGPTAALNCVTEGATWMPMPTATVRLGHDRPGHELLLFYFDDEPLMEMKKCDS